MPQGFVLHSFQYADGGMLVSWQIISVLTMTAGTVFLMWLGEQIDEFGIGNGISLLIMAGILANMPGAGWELLAEGVARVGRRRQQAGHRRPGAAGAACSWPW